MTVPSLYSLLSGSALFLEPFDFEQVSAIAYSWLKDYLHHNPNVEQNGSLCRTCN